MPSARIILNYLAGSLLVAVALNFGIGLMWGMEREASVDATLLTGFLLFALVLTDRQKERSKDGSNN